MTDSPSAHRDVRRPAERAVQTRAALWGALLALLVAQGCGQPLVDGDYRGEPLLKIEGQLASLETLPPEWADGAVRVALFWSPTGRSDVAPDQLLEQPSVSAALDFPGRFALNIYHPPEARFLVPASPSYGLALVLVYVDLDDNGRLDLDAGDRLIGGATERAVFYAPEPIPASSSYTGEALPEGLFATHLLVNCAPSLGDLPRCPDAQQEGLGMPCDVNDGPQSTCASGLVCIHDEAGPLADTGVGLCVMEVDGVDATQCALDDAVYTAFDEEYGIWLPRCTTDADCPTDVGYTCDLSLRHCMQRTAACDPSRGITPGAPCADDADCGSEGLCMTRGLLGFYPGGYCLYPDTIDCTPERAALIYDEPGTESFENFEDLDDDGAFYWFEACASDDDCRTDAGYGCDPLYKLCDPGVSVVLLSIDPAFDVERDVEPLCASDDDVL